MEEVLHDRIASGGPSQGSRIHLLQALAQLTGPGNLLLGDQFVDILHQRLAQIGHAVEAQAGPAGEPPGQAHERVRSLHHPGVKLAFGALLAVEVEDAGTLPGQRGPAQQAGEIVAQRRIFGQR